MNAAPITSKPVRPANHIDLFVTLAVALVLSLLTAFAVRLATTGAERDRAAEFSVSAERVGNAVRALLADHYELIERWRNILAVSPALSQAQLESLFQGSRQRQNYPGIGPLILAVPGRPVFDGPHRTNPSQRAYAVMYQQGETRPGALASLALGSSPEFRAVENRSPGQQKPALVRLRTLDAQAASLPALVVPVLAGDGQVGCWIVVWIDFARTLERIGETQVPQGYSLHLRQSNSSEILAGWNPSAGSRGAIVMGRTGVPASRLARTSVDFAGERLELAISAPEDALFRSDAEWPVVIGVGGSVLVMLATLGTHMLLKRRREAGELRMRLTGALRAGEQRFRDLVETTPDWVWETDGDGIYTYCSPSCAMLFGYAPEDIVGTRGEVLWGPGRSEVTAGVKLRVARHRSGKSVTLESSSVPVRDAGGNQIGLRGFDRDVSRRVALEEELRLLQNRLIGATQAESVGQAMVGLAHELNQPLAAVVTYNQACLRMVEADERINPDIREAMRATASHALLASDIVRKFRDLVGGRRVTHTWLRIEGIVNHAIDIASTRKNREKVRIKVDIEKDLPDVSGDATLLVQVVLNLLNNAMDAVSRSRVREITVRAHRDSAKHVDGKVRVEIIDTGDGISDVARSQMFEPYFTTKLDGVGMGLAVCRSIIEAHGEEINADTTGDGRTIFWFTLAAREVAHA